MQHAPKSSTVRAAAEVARQTAWLQGYAKIIVTPERVQDEIPPEGPYVAITARATSNGTVTRIENHRSG